MSPLVWDLGHLAAFEDLWLCRETGLEPLRRDLDLVKDRAVLEAAYNGSEGVTAEFNRNVLRVINAGLTCGLQA